MADHVLTRAAGIKTIQHLPFSLSLSLSVSRFLARCPGRRQSTNSGRIPSRFKCMLREEGLSSPTKSSTNTLLSTLIGENSIEYELFGSARTLPPRCYFHGLRAVSWNNAEKWKKQIRQSRISSKIFEPLYQNFRQDQTRFGVKFWTNKVKQPRNNLAKHYVLMVSQQLRQTGKKRWKSEENEEISQLRNLSKNTSYFCVPTLGNVV